MVVVVVAGLFDRPWRSPILLGAGARATCEIRETGTVPAYLELEGGRSAETVVFATGRMPWQHLTIIMVNEFDLAIQYLLHAQFAVSSTGQAMEARD